MGYNRLSFNITQLPLPPSTRSGSKGGRTGPREVLRTRGYMSVLVQSTRRVARSCGQPCVQRHPEEKMRPWRRVRGDGVMELLQCLKPRVRTRIQGSQTSPVGSVAAVSGPTRPLLCAALTSQLREASFSALAKPRAEETCLLCSLLPSASQGNCSSILLL